MIIDLEKYLLRPLVIFSRIDAKNTGYTDGRDVYAVTQVRGTWRKISAKTADAQGNVSPAGIYKVQVPDAGEFRPYTEFVADHSDGYTLSTSDYVALEAELSADGVKFADGFVLPYEVTADGFGIVSDQNGVINGVTIGRFCSPEQVIQQVRRHGGFAVKTWRDLRGDGAIQSGGVPGVFASALYMEG